MRGHEAATDGALGPVGREAAECLCDDTEEDGGVEEDGQYLYPLELEPLADDSCSATGRLICRRRRSISPRLRQLLLGISGVVLLVATGSMAILVYKQGVDTLSPQGNTLSLQGDDTLSSTRPRLRRGLTLTQRTRPSSRSSRRPDALFSDLWSRARAEIGLSSLEWPIKDTSLEWPSIYRFYNTKFADSNSLFRLPDPAQPNTSFTFSYMPIWKDANNGINGNLKRTEMCAHGTNNCPADELATRISVGANV